MILLITILEYSTPPPPDFIFILRLLVYKYTYTMPYTEMIKKPYQFQLFVCLMMDVTINFQWFYDSSLLFLAFVPFNILPSFFVSPFLPRLYSLPLSLAFPRWSSVCFTCMPVIHKCAYVFYHSCMFKPACVHTYAKCQRHNIFMIYVHVYENIHPCVLKLW